MSLEETPSTIPKNWIYIKGVSWKEKSNRDTRHLPQFDKFECLMNLISKLKMSLEETPSIIPKTYNLYKMCQRWRCPVKRHLLEFQKIIFILNVSLGKTLYTIPQNPICILFVEMILKLKMSLFNVWKLWKVSLQETLSFLVLR